MHFTVLFSALLPLLAIANPVPEAIAEAEAEPAVIEARAGTCALTGSNVRYRQKATTKSPADGQFGAKGTRVPFSCFTTGESINGNNLWNRVASGKGAGDYVSDTFVSRSCSSQITTHC